MNLSNTNFSGKLPDAISNLKQLSVLDLSNCQFIETLPISISDLTHLVHVVLSFNKFTGPLPSFKTLKNLTYLSLLHNNLLGTIPTTHFDGLESVLIINLGDNSLDGKIPVSLFTLPSLQELTLCHNGFDSQLDEFPNISSSKLQLIDLSSNKLQGPIPNSIFHLEGLRFLQLSANEFSGTIRLDMVQRLQNLHTLGLSHNKLSVDITFIDDHDLSSFPSMKYLSLASCNLGEFPGFQGKIHEAFCNFSYLRLLDLSYNSFNDFIPMGLMKRNSTLRVLNLAENKLQGYISDTISSSHNLRFLNLNGNLLGGVIPSSLANCQSLQVLNLGSNQFSDRFPCFLRNISTLRVLILRSNKLNGPIPCPHNTGNWEMLHIVDLASNNSTGLLPGPVLRSWTKMLADHIFAYYVTSNQFGGRYLNSVTIVVKGVQMKLIKIPTIFTSLDVSSNHFEGPIPQELASLSTLYFLNLSTFSQAISPHQLEI
ncbi:hypothetical protein VNO78_15610 [Psophocarpus tetragonolobus]|uniref:Disease resistance R13L4/SHOC-2-like LRR domain-containing protein n=1 Tax=Psophocarpus tetragonolobus TaxID=3891 RepID=A0AAN9XK24_PSOTE